MTLQARTYDNLVPNIRIAKEPKVSLRGAGELPLNIKKIENLSSLQNEGLSLQNAKESETKHEFANFLPPQVILREYTPFKSKLLNLVSSIMYS